MTAAGLERLWDALLDDPSSSAVFLDYDGTLAPIVDDPAMAALPDGLAEVLTDLATLLGSVVVITGRSLDFLQEHLPPAVDMVGLYGLEQLISGERRDHEQSGAWREVVDHVAAASVKAGPEGMRVESKGLSVTLHFREHPELAPAVRKTAEEQAARSGLVVHPAKMSVELNPPIDMDKGSALKAFLDSRDHPLRSVVYIGDDLGDLSAFATLGELSAGPDGVAVVRVAVGGIECPGELREAADLLLDSPRAVAESLIDLRDRLQ